MSQALFTVEGEIIQHVEELEEVANHLRLLPHSVGLTSAAHAQLQSTVANVKLQAESLLASAKQVHDQLQVSS